MSVSSPIKTFDLPLFVIRVVEIEIAVFVLIFFFCF